MDDPEYYILDRLRDAANAAWVITAMIVLLCCYFVKNLAIFLLEKLYELFVKRKSFDA